MRAPAAAVVTAALALTACTSGSSSGTRPAGEGTRQGGVLRVGVTAPGSVDPGDLYEPVGRLVGALLCDPLIAADPDTGELLPALAETFVVSDDGARLVLRLRSGLRFSDGSEVVADDLVFAWSRVASADFASRSSEVLAPVLGYAEIHGDVEAEDSADLRRLKGVRAVDDRTVEITLSEPRADFVRRLTDPLLSPLPRGLAERDPRAFARQPVCTGPYRLTAPVEPGASAVRLERWEGYRAPVEALTRGGAGYVDAVELTVFSTAAAAAAAARDGQVDLAPATAQDTDAESQPGSEIEYVGLPSGEGSAFADPRLRRALALALDRPALVAAVAPRSRVAHTGFLPPAAARPIEELDDAPDDPDDPDKPGCADLPAAGDPAAAVALLRESTYDPAVALPLLVNPDGVNVALAEEVARQWRAVLGVRVTVTSVPLDDLLRRGRSASGLDGAFRFSWSTRTPDPDGHLVPLFTTDGIGRDNLSRFSDPRLDDLLLRQARRATDPADRALDQRAAEQLLCEQLPMIPLTLTLDRWLVSDRVASATDDLIDPGTGLPQLRETYLR